MARTKGLSQQSGSVTPKSGDFAGQTFVSYRSLQNARAQAKGHQSHATRLATPKEPASSVLSDVAKFEKSTAGRANRAVLELRRDPGLTFTQAAKLAKTTPGAVKRYAGTSLERVGKKMLPKRDDRALVTMSVLTSDGPVVGIVRGSKMRNRIGQHNAWLNQVINAPSPANTRKLAKFAKRPLIFADGRRASFASSLAEVQDLVRRGLYSGNGPYDTENLDVAA